MTSAAPIHSRFAARVARRGFSLPEMMIALVILGLGLLFIAAALPVGLTYTRETIDRATAEAAAEHALSQISTYARTSNQVLVSPDPVYPALPANLIRRDSIVRPRATPASGGAPVGGVLPESNALMLTGGGPAVKVRPLVGVNVNLNSNPPAEVPDNGEDLIGVWLGAVGLPTTLEQADYAPSNALSLTANPEFPPALRVFPPVTSVQPFRVTDFLSNSANYPQYAPRSAFSSGTAVNELRKMADARTVWTAFYRRVRYGPGSDPLLYEMIVVVCGRPTAQHKFAPQNSTSGFATPQAVAGVDLVAPSPWLMVFSGLPGSPALIANEVNRELPFAPELPLVFTLQSAASSALFPVGTVFIPAVNDGRASANSASTVPGFTPHAPTALPIYEVSSRPDSTTVVVKNNGFYPFAPGGSQNWPVWVIPPAYVQRDGNGQPLFENRSPVLAVSRRFVRLREIP